MSLPADTPPAVADALGYLQHHLQELTKRQNALEHTINATLAGLTAQLQQLTQLITAPVLTVAPPPMMGIKRFDHETKVKARSERRNLQAASQLCTKQVGTGEINQIIKSLLKVKVQRITKTYQIET